MDLLVPRDISIAKSAKIVIAANGSITLSVDMTAISPAMDPKAILQI
jgi:hypothetical protein